jgi:hypothetical protein
MKVNNDAPTIQVSFRLNADLVARMREVASSKDWPPPPSQTEIVSRGIEMVLAKLKPKRGRARVAA